MGGNKMSNQSKKLYKSSTDKQIMGVCGGLAEFFNIDSTIVRVIFVALVIAGGSGFGLYIILGLILPYDFQVKGGQTKTKSTNSFMCSKPSSGDRRKDVTPEDTDNWHDF